MARPYPTSQARREMRRAARSLNSRTSLSASPEKSSRRFSISRRGTYRKRYRPRQRSRRSIRSYQKGAQSRLKRYRQQSALAIALTGTLLMIWGVDEVETANGQEPTANSETAQAETQAGDSAALPPTDPSLALEEATDTLREIALSFYALLPKFCVVLGILVVAAVVVRILRGLIFRFFGQWERAAAVSALSTICVYLVALVVALSIIAGDARALLGSVGLVGLALSWALQTPIESFTGWLINSFRSYYRVGDRIEVGDVFGDVYKIDVLTTTVWEAGGPGKAVQGAQPTGAMITFPNWEVLRSNIVNYSRDFPYVWDEVSVGVTNESDLEYAIEVVAQTARETLGEMMREPARQYQHLIKDAIKSLDVSEEPQVFVSSAEAWTDLTVRYLVHSRERRHWSTALLVALAKEMGRNHHDAKMRGAYPRTEILVAPSNDSFADFIRQESLAATSQEK